MKLATLAIAMLGILPVAASAATCSSIQVGSTIAAPTASAIPGNTCTDPNALAIAKACGTTLNGAGESVYGIQLGASYSNVAITVHTTGTDTNTGTCTTSTCQFWPGIYFLTITGTNANNGCGSQPCANGNTVQQNDTTDAVLNVQAGLTGPRTFFFIVGDTNSAGADGLCGPFNLSVTGTLPVKLEKFSVD